MRIDIDFSDTNDVLATSQPIPGKIGCTNRVRFENHEEVLPWLQILTRSGLDGNMRVFIAGTDYRVYIDKDVDDEI